MNTTIHTKIDSFVEYNEESNEKNPKFKVFQSIRIFLLKDMLLIGVKKFLL